MLNVRGTQDFINTKLLLFIYTHARKCFTCYDFEEIITPILEPLALYHRTLGIATDVVTKQMFIIQSQDDEEKICLRPELTASTMRTFLQHPELPTPWKIFSIGPCFRYERPQRGRYRQFHQINTEIVGSASIWQDARLITMLDRFFTHYMDLDTYALLINFLGCPTDRQTYSKKLYEYAKTQQEGLCSLCITRLEKNILRILDCKKERCRDLLQQAPKITNYLCSTCNQEWQQLQESLQLLAISFTHDPFLVRGLDYYDKTVFEFVSQNLGAQSAFCSGGRYNHLAEQLGAKKPVACVGAAIGVERLMLLLEPQKDQLSLPESPVAVAVLPVNDAQKNIALLVADELQANHICTTIMLDGTSLKSMLRKANKSGIRWCVIIGQEEQEAGTVRLKSMTQPSEQIVKQAELVQHLQ